eukprot:5383159-Prymnesium_polylepis.1
MSKAALILKEDAKRITEAHVFSDTLWKNKKTQATNPPTPLWNSPLTEEGYFSDMEYFGIQQYGTNDQLFKAKETPLSLYTWKMHNPQDSAKFVSCCGVPY